MGRVRVPFRASMISSPSVTAHVARGGESASAHLVRVRVRVRVKARVRIRVKARVRVKG